MPHMRVTKRDLVTQDHVKMAVKLVETQLVEMLEVLKTSYRWIKVTLMYLLPRSPKQEVDTEGEYGLNRDDDLSLFAPFSFQIVGEVEAALEHRIIDYEFVVDKWPDCRAMVVRAKDNDIQLKYLEPLVNLYATDDEALRSLLHNLDWSKGKRFECVDRRLVPVLSEVIQLYHVPTFVLGDYILMRVTQDTLKLRPIPEGCTMSSLTTDQAARVNSRWKLLNGDVSVAYIKHLITTLPSTCLYNREGTLLGYALTYHYGCLGVLYVLEEHRGNGYGKVAMSQLALKHLQKNKEVFVMIQRINTASIKMHEAIGFEVIPDTSFDWILCDD